MKCGAEDFEFYYMCPSKNFVLWAQFLQFFQMPEYLYKMYNSTLKDLKIEVRPYLMRNIELKTSNLFAGPSTHGLGYLGPGFPNGLMSEHL